jgi:hypothetical protein
MLTVGDALGRGDGANHVVDVADAHCRPEQRLIDDQPAYADEGESAEEQRPQGRRLGSESLAVAIMRSGEFTEEVVGGRTITVGCSQELLPLTSDR